MKYAEFIDKIESEKFGPKNQDGQVKKQERTRH